VIEIKETAEERRNGKSKTADEKRNVNDGFVSVFCRNSDPTTDPPRTEFLRRKDSDRHEMEKIGFRNNRHVVTCERQLAVGIDGRNDCDKRTLSLPLRRHLNLAGERSGSNIAREQRRSGCRKARLELRMQRHAIVQYIWGFPGPDAISKKVPSHHPAVISNGVPCHHSAVISKTVDAAQYNSAAISKNADVFRLHSARFQSGRCGLL
jgi:hypothetical protein